LEKKIKTEEGYISNNNFKNWKQLKDIVLLLRLSYPCNRPWRSIGLWDVEGPTFSRQSAHRWRWGSQAFAPAALYPAGRFLVLNSIRGWVWLKGLGQLKNPMTLSGTEPTTFRLVAQCLVVVPMTCVFKYPFQLFQ
jgi:hypothetical protein